MSALRYLTNGALSRNEKSGSIVALTIGPITAGIGRERDA
jgi:hypothetical protein